MCCCENIQGSSAQWATDPWAQWKGKEVYFSGEAWTDTPQPAQSLALNEGINEGGNRRKEGRQRDTDVQQNHIPFQWTLARGPWQPKGPPFTLIPGSKLSPMMSDSDSVRPVAYRGCQQRTSICIRMNSGASLALWSAAAGYRNPLAWERWHRVAPWKLEWQKTLIPPLSFNLISSILSVLYKQVWEIALPNEIAYLPKVEFYVINLNCR